MHELILGNASNNWTTASVSSYSPLLPGPDFSCSLLNSTVVDWSKEHQLSTALVDVVALKVNFKQKSLSMTLLPLFWQLLF